VVSLALKYVGAYYVMGGVGPRGFDCSGFVYYILNHSGVRMSRDMYAQWTSGTHISSNNLQPGDLVFFSNTYKRGLSHVAIYIGNGRIVHAENESTGVTISDLWSSYYSSHYTGAVRPSNYGR
jgi:cell wall-associated NlpC family hydrolase